MVEFEHWNELIEQAKNREITGITAATKTPERSEYLDFTVPYILNPNVIITRENFSEKLTFEKLAETTMEILVVEDYAIIEFLDENYPKLEYREVISASEGLRKVSFGEADAMVVEIMSASASIDRDNLTNLIVNTETSYESNLSIATRSDWPMLNDILNKGLAQISESERQHIKAKWIPFERRNLLQNPYFWIVLGSIILLLIITIIIVSTWNRSLKKAVREKTFALEASKKQLIKEIEERKMTADKLKESRKRFRALAKYSTDLIIRFDRNLKCLYANPAVQKILTGDIKSITGLPLKEIGLPVKLTENLESAIRTVFENSVPCNIEFKLGKRWYHWSLMPEFSEGNQRKVSAVITSARDITERKITEEKIRYKSYHDELTDLHNRAYFNEKLVELNKEEFMPLSVILADLNGLKITNDTLGHKAGDQLIVRISRILEEVCRTEDIIARIGGDEFVILLPNTTEDTTRKICRRIQDACDQSPKDPIQPSVALGYATKNSVSKDIEVVFKRAEDDMYHNKMNQSEKSSVRILESLEELLRETTNETYEHSDHLRELSLAIGKKLKLSTQKLNILSSLADLHDIGKVAISQDILQKKEALTLEEWERVKRHPELGFKIANSTPKLSQISEGILSHHERWDGTGYPQGLEKEEIPLLARIISIVDAYDVMISGRPYKKAVTKDQAIKELKKSSGSQFDPKLVNLFINDIIN
jgi:diguanylate cyclase (GGDEF)-like protein/PAS domain S-box-containing protein